MDVRSLAMYFEMHNKCEACNGKGEVVIPIYTEDIIAIVSEHIDCECENSKITAVKQVRQNYNLNLKFAKELVEGALFLHNVILENAVKVKDPNDVISYKEFTQTIKTALTHTTLDEQTVKNHIPKEDIIRIISDSLHQRLWEIEETK